MPAIRDASVVLSIASLAAALSIAGCGPPSPAGGESGLRAVKSNAKRIDKPARVIALNRDLGVVAPNSEGLHSFEITNNSTQSWHLKSITRSCSCVSADLSFTTILPGSSVNVDMIISTGSEPKQIRQSVLIAFEEVDAPLYRLNLSAISVGGLQVGKKRYSKRIMPGIRQWRFELPTEYCGDEDAIVTAMSPAEWLSVSIRRTSVPNEGTASSWVIECLADLSAAKPHESLNTSVRIAARHSEGRKEEVAVPISLAITSPIRPSRSNVFLGEVKRGQSISETVELVYDDYHAASVSGLKAEHTLGGSLKLTLIPATNRDSQLLLTFTAPENSEGGVYDGVVIVSGHVDDSAVTSASDEGKQHAFTQTTRGIARTDAFSETRAMTPELCRVNVVARIVD